MLGNVPNQYTVNTWRSTSDLVTLSAGPTSTSQGYFGRGRKNNVLSFSQDIVRISFCYKGSFVQVSCYYWSSLWDMWLYQLTSSTPWHRTVGPVQCDHVWCPAPVRVDHDRCSQIATVESPASFPLFYQFVGFFNIFHSSSLSKWPKRIFRVMKICTLTHKNNRTQHRATVELPSSEGYVNTRWGQEKRKTPAMGSCLGPQGAWKTLDLESGGCGHGTSLF